MKENLTWKNSKGQEYYFDYKIKTKMKEQDERKIENCSLEQLFAIDDLLHLEEDAGWDVGEAQDKVWEVINKKLKAEEQNPYTDCTKEDLENLLLKAQRLEDEGLGMTETIIKVEEALEEKVDSGIIYEAD